MKSYQALANAIVVYAVKDYKRALKAQKRNPNNEDYQLKIDLLEHFFRSNWFQLLTDLDEEVLMNSIRREVLQ